MRRFYQNAEAVRSDAGWAVALDAKPVKTPGRQPLAVPTQSLGDAIAAEWAGQEEEIDPAAMPLTGFANAAIDLVTKDTKSFAADIAKYGETDLLCYRAESPVELVTRQCEAWDPIVDWAKERFGVELVTTSGIVHSPQPEATVARLSEEVAGRDPFHLAGLSPLVSISGSLIAPLALAEGAFDEDAVWTAARIDEAWQAEQWGEDEEAIAARDAKHREFSAAMRFLRLLDS